jgi:hypothetical protein
LLKIVGALLFLGGIGFAIYYFAYFETSVPVPVTEILGRSIGGGRVQNLGLLQDRQNGIIFSSAAAILGFLLVVFAERLGTRTGGVKSLWLAVVIAALAALAVATNKRIDRWREEIDQAMAAVAEENKAAVVLGQLRTQYDLLPGGVVRLNNNAFPAQLARINAEFDAQRAKARGNLKDRAKIEAARRSRIKALQDETAAMIHKMEAALKDQEAQLRALQAARQKVKVQSPQR